MNQMLYQKQMQDAPAVTGDRDVSPAQPITWAMRRSCSPISGRALANKVRSYFEDNPKT